MEIFCILTLFTVVGFLLLGSHYSRVLYLPEMPEIEELKNISTCEDNIDKTNSRFRVVGFIYSTLGAMGVKKKEVLQFLHDSTSIIFFIVGLSAAMACCLLRTNLAQIFLSIGLFEFITFFFVFVYSFKKAQKFYKESHLYDELIEGMKNANIQVKVNNIWVGNQDCIPYLKENDRVELKLKSLKVGFSVKNEEAANETPKNLI